MVLRVQHKIVAALLCALVTAVALFALNGCSPAASRQSSNASNSTSSLQDLAPITVGTLATEDILPLWVAQEQGWLADFNLDIKTEVFQSATELIAGFASGEVDMAMTDIMVAASMYASGIDLQIEWITLGAQSDQGRFGIMVGPQSSITSLDQLAGVSIGVGSNTILEYVMDKLLENAGVPADQIVVEEIQKLPVRYQAMLSGEVEAAALPGSLLALGEANGCTVIADDTMGSNISTSVMIVRSDFLTKPGGKEAVDAFKKAWNETVTDINEDSEAFREVLVKNANLSEQVAETYPISTYPVCELPTNQMVDPVLEWMTQKGYLTRSLTYDQNTGTFAFAN